MLIKKLIAICLLVVLISCGITIKSAQSPVLSLELWRENKDWGQLKVKQMIEWVSREYDCDTSLMLWLAEKESSYKIDAVGDKGKAVSLFQFWESTWDLFSKKFGLSGFDRNNPVDNTIMACLAIKSGYGYHWTPLQRAKIAVEVK